MRLGPLTVAQLYLKSQRKRQQVLIITNIMGLNISANTIKRQEFRMTVAQSQTRIEAT